MENRVLTYGDKIKIIRRKYNLRQEDLSGKDVTRNLICFIENGKASLTESTAKIVMKNLKKMAKRKHFKVDETIDYLMENEIAQANKIIDYYIKELKNFSVYNDCEFIETLNKAEKFIKSFDLNDKKVELFQLAGDFYSMRKDYYKGALYYEKANEITNIGSFDELNILRKLSAIYINAGMYNYSIERCNYALKHFKMPNNFSRIFIYNSALAYNQLGNFDAALSRLNLLETNLDNTDLSLKFDFMNLKAECLRGKKGKQDEAIKIYKNILDELKSVDDPEKELIVNINILLVLIELKSSKDEIIHDFGLVNKLLKKLNLNSWYMPEIYFELGNIYKYIDKYLEAEKYYKKALESAKKNKRYKVQDKAISSLIALYTKLRDVKGIDEINIEFCVISNMEGHINDINISKLIKFYNENNCSAQISKLCNFVIKSKEKQEVV